MSNIAAVNECAVIRLDLSGLRCPLPVLRLKKAIKQHGEGVFFVTTTDPDSVSDFYEYAKIKGLDVVLEHGESCFNFKIIVKA